ncbi:MAG: hypothetical protein K2K74_11355, partial [Lachnospiraceae bacterium]|nr:hypothetical protein [Lachnospiraceae bacterium]
MLKQMECTGKKITSQAAITLIFVMVLLLSFSGFVKKEQTKTQQKAKTPTEESVGRQVEQILASMSMRQKICQMFIVTPEVLTDGANATTADEIM